MSKPLACAHIRWPVFIALTMTTLALWGLIVALALFIKEVLF